MHACNVPRVLLERALVWNVLMTLVVVFMIKNGCCYLILNCSYFDGPVMAKGLGFDEKVGLAHVDTNTVIAHLVQVLRYGIFV